MSISHPRTKEIIVIAEDDIFVRRVTARLLEKCGYHILEARDGKEALQIICDHAGPIHLLFTDVLMPGLNGRQLADIARALRPGLPVLFTSAHTQNMIVVRGILDVGFEFIEKSYDPQKLIRKIRHLIEMAKKPAYLLSPLVTQETLGQEN